MPNHFLNALCQYDVIDVEHIFTTSLLDILSVSGNRNASNAGPSSPHRAVNFFETMILFEDSDRK